MIFWPCELLDTGKIRLSFKQRQTMLDRIRQVCQWMTSPDPMGNNHDTLRNGQGFIMMRIMDQDSRCSAANVLWNPENFAAVHS